MRDKFLLGAIFGVLANIPKEIIDFTIYLLGSKFYCWMIPAGITLSPKWNGTFWGIVVGGLNDFIIAAVLGVGLTYFLEIMEKKYLFVKGMCYSFGIWLFFCMMIVTRISYWTRMKDPGFYFQNFVAHQIWGLVATWLIVKYIFRKARKKSI
jgi:hypothetical protein